MQYIKPKTKMIKTADDKCFLKAAVFEPIETAVGIVQVVHGFGEHIGRYYELAEFFAENKYICVIHDQRGHGEMPDLSAKDRKKLLGIAKSYGCFLDDIDLVRNEVISNYQEKKTGKTSLPVFLYGHSMGGNIALNYVLRRSMEETYSGLILETPWFRLYKPKHKNEVKVAHLLGLISHKLAISSKLNADILSRDTVVTDAIKNDKLFHTRMSYRLFAQLTYAGEFCMENASKLPIPTLILCGGKDKIACPKAMREFGEEAGEALTFYEDSEGYHVLRQDLEPTKSQMLSQVLEWLDCNNRLAH
jgi:lysophospholipase